MKLPSTTAQWKNVLIDGKPEDEVIKEVVTAAHVAHVENILQQIVVIDKELKSKTITPEQSQALITERNNLNARKQESNNIISIDRIDDPAAKAAAQKSFDAAVQSTKEIVNSYADDLAKAARTPVQTEAERIAAYVR